MSRAATSLSLRGSGQALLRRGCASSLSTSRALALALHPTSPAIHAPRRLLSHAAQIARIESELARIEADAVARFGLTSTAIDNANLKIAAAANTAGDRAFDADLNVGQVSMRVAATVLGLTVGGGVAALQAFRLTSDKASRDRTDAHVASEIAKMRIGLDKALDEVLLDKEKEKLAALAGLEAREKAAAATSIQQDNRERSLRAREQALSKKQDEQ